MHTHIPAVAKGLALPINSTATTTGSGVRPHRGRPTGIQQGRICGARVGAVNKTTAGDTEKKLAQALTFGP